MKKLLTAIAIIAALYSTNARAWSYGEFVSCDAINPRPRIIFKTSYGKLIHDLSTSTAGINAIASRSNNAAHENGLLAAGIAVVSTGYSINIRKGTAQVLDENAVCVLPEEIEIFIGYKNPLIYVSNEYPQQSCEFSHIIRHEQTHQRINKLTLEYFLPLLDETIREAVTDVRAVKVANTDAATIQEGLKLLNAYYIARLTPILEEFEKARLVEQLKLDNMTNYRNEWKVCKDFYENNPEKVIKK